MTSRGNDSPSSHAQPVEPADAFRYVDRITRTMMKAWIAREPIRKAIPWTPLDKPLSECRVGLVSTGAIRLATGQQPFDMQGERDDPWWGDPTMRELPSTVTTNEIRCDHHHVERSGIEADLGCVVPIRLLNELADDGVIGSVAPTWYSYQGYILRPDDVLMPKTVPAIVDGLKSQDVDVVLLVPV